MSSEAASGESPFTAGFGSAAGRSAVAGPDSDDLPAVDSPSSAFAAIGRTDPETDEADVISEADIYIAYGRYREAEDLLRDEMARAPDRVELKLKLAEAYFGAKNHQALRDLMDEMRAEDQGRIGPDQWQRLAEMVAAGESKPRADAGPRPTPRAGAAAPAPDLDPGGSVEEYFSLDISDAGRPSADLSLNTPLEDTKRPVPVAPAWRSPAAPPRGDRSSSPILEDDPPLLADDDAFTRSLALDAHSDGLGLDIPSTPVLGREFSGGVSDLELTIDDLRAASDVDLESFVDSTRTLSTLADDLTLERADPIDTLLRATQPPATTTEAAPRSAASALPSLELGKEESASSDLLSSQWQMDSGLWDETATKLDLARAYLEMADKDAARGILEEVVAEGNEAQRREAKELLRGLG
jgi:pilus assembly protein FimV